jgi:hypothetical protein
MEPTVTEATTGVSMRSNLARQRLRERCTQAIMKLLPQPDSRARGVWNEDSIRTITAVFELQRVELHSELDERKLDNNLIAKVIEVLTLRAYFPDSRSPTLLYEMEAHLRLLATAIRMYKYNGRCLDHQLHNDVYTGITNLWKIFDRHRTTRDDALRVEDWNAAFLIKHCQYLLVSIDDSESFAKKVARRAVLGLEGAATGLGHHYTDTKHKALEIAKRNRLRPRWHDEFIQLEDACWTVIAGDIRIHESGDFENDIAAIVDEEMMVTHLLRDGIETHLDDHQTQPSKFSSLVRHTLGRSTHYLQQAGPYEEHDEYFCYGILDLIYQLSFRIRKRSRRRCFSEFLKVALRILEERKSSPCLCLKATDIWNRIAEIGDKDRLVYGDVEDRDAINRWINQYGINAEKSEFSSSLCPVIELPLMVVGGQGESTLPSGSFAERKSPC